MGIKFHCPNGHKLNVKSFLSGKRAICPECGAKVLVPEVSTARAGASAGGQRAATSADTPSGNDSGRLEQTPDDSSPQIDLAAPQAMGAAGGSGPAAANGTPQSAFGHTPLYGAIAEAPGAVWYVRPPSGGQFGPAAGEAMRGWIEGGRVAGAALVWRAGWQEWRTASSVFPHLAGASGGGAPLAPPLPGGALASAINPIGPQALGPAATATVVTPLTVQPTGAAPAGRIEADIFGVVGEQAPALRSQRRRKSKNDTSLIATIVLIVVALVLIVVLIVVLNRNPEQKTEDAQSRAAALNRMLSSHPRLVRG